MATNPATKTLSKREQDAAARKVEALRHDLQKREDLLFLAQAEADKQALDSDLKARLASAMEDASHIDPEELRSSFTSAHTDYVAAGDARKHAEILQERSLVIMSRDAFIASIHPAIVGTGKQNISKAGEALGMPYSTIRPYVLAGGALFRHDRAFLLSEPEPLDVTIVNDSFDANSRKAQVEKRQRAAIKAAESEAARIAAEAEAERLRAELEAAQAQNGNGASAPSSAPSAPEAAPEAATGNGEASAPASAPEAPAKAPEAPASAPAVGTSVTEDILRTARELVKMGKAQRKNDNAEWQKTHAELVKVLSDLFPTIGK